MSTLIERNTIIPIKVTRIFTTRADNQFRLGIIVYEGEHRLARDNHLLGGFQFFPIPLVRRGLPKIEVTFDIDANGI